MSEPLLFVTIVLDGVGIGEQPDAGVYGDAGSHTLRHVCEVARPQMPNLAAMGLGCIEPLPGVATVEAPRASYGKMREVSAGKDSTTGHWELAGLLLDHPFPTYPDGFPEDLLSRFREKSGCTGTLGHRPASGTDVIAQYGPEHERTGFPIVYTSADSVFQIAAHKDIIPLDELYRLCRIAREEVCVGEHAVGRVIARPFVGEAGNYQRVSGERKDYSRLPDGPVVQQVLQENGVRTMAVGKIADLFGGIGFDEVRKTRSNDEGIEKTLAAMREVRSQPTFLWTNLVDFDQEYGHRNDPEGFARALEAFDTALPDLLAALPQAGVLVLTADHGNDPTTPSTDHSREYVPLLVIRPGQPVQALGLRDTFADHAASVANFFGVPFSCPGRSFL